MKLLKYFIAIRNIFKKKEGKNLDYLNWAYTKIRSYRMKLLKYFFMTGSIFEKKEGKKFRVFKLSLHKS